MQKAAKYLPCSRLVDAADTMPALGQGQDLWFPRRL